MHLKLNKQHQQLKHLQLLLLLFYLLHIVTFSLIVTANSVIIEQSKEQDTSGKQSPATDEQPFGELKRKRNKLFLFFFLLHLLFATYF